MTTNSAGQVQIDASTKFLVVGATGHVGSKIAVLLADKGYDVTALIPIRAPSVTSPATSPTMRRWPKPSKGSTSSSRPPTA
jgi:hypothetical protein